MVEFPQRHAAEKALLSLQHLVSLQEDGAIKSMMISQYCTFARFEPSTMHVHSLLAEMTNNQPLIFERSRLLGSSA